jgi:hypothetical protein
MYKEIILVLFSLLLWSTHSVASSVPKLEEGRIAVVSGAIANGLSDVEDAMAAWSSDGTKKPISLVINSPGGSVVTGFWFLNKMEAVRKKGVKINCFVPDLAASMAFQILVHCDRRVILSKALLLWHPVRTGTDEPITAELAKELRATLLPLDAVIYKELKRMMFPDQRGSYTFYHFRRETLHVGSNLAEDLPSSFQAVDSVDGLYEALNNAQLPRNKKQFSFFGSSGEGIQYIAPEYIRSLVPVWE